MKLTRLLLLALWLLLIPSLLLAAGFEPAARTPEWVDFWGQLTVKGEPALPGDQVAVFDPQGVCCGVSTVTAQSAVPSLYPFLHVYGDDPATSDVDEGAVSGDLLTFKVYRASEDKVYGASVRLHPQDAGAPDPPRWVAPPPGLSGWQVDVEVVSLLWELPNWNVPFGQPFPQIDLDAYLAEPGYAGQVSWAAQALGGAVLAAIIDGHLLVVTAPPGWSGQELVRITGSLGEEVVSQDVAFTVGANRAPQLAAPGGPWVLREGERLVVELEATDPDGNALSFSLEPEVPNAALEPVAPLPGRTRSLLVFRPDYGQAGDYTFTARASDGYLSDEAGLDITVQNVAGATVVQAWDLVPGVRYELTVAGTGTWLDGLRIIIPEGALPYPVRLTAGLIEDALLPPLPAGAFGFRFHLGPEGLVFGEPVTIIAPYGPNDPVGDLIAVYRFGEGVAGWSTAYVDGVAIDREENTVSYRTARFSSFTPAATASSQGAAPQADNPTPSGAAGGCFIATVAFGSPLEREVAHLRLLRDRWLLSCHPGRRLVAAYYRLGPAAARFIAGHPKLAGPVRATLYPLVALGWAAQGGAPLPWLAGLGLACALALRQRRR